MSSAQINSRFNRRRSVTFGATRSQDMNLGGDLNFTIRQFYDITLNYNQGRNVSTNLVTNTVTNRSITHSGSGGTGFNWNIWRFTTSVAASRSKAVDALGKLTTDSRSIQPAVSARGDFSLPTGLGLPLTSKRLTFTNRVILTSGLSLDRKTSTLNIEQSNTDNWNWNLNGDFEIGKNLRAGLGSGVNFFKNRVLTDQNFYTLNVNAQIIFQF